jgi:dTDP-glucose pyrophosphorylase
MVIKAGLEAEFRAQVGDRLTRQVPVSYAVQDVTQVPPGYGVPTGRVKPWGTAHGLLAARPQIDGPFVVMNADDFYGRQGFARLAEFLSEPVVTARKEQWAMVGYQVEHTLTDHGTVARGVCQIDSTGHLIDIVECTDLEPTAGGAQHSADGGQTWTIIPDGTPVSMNLWGLTPAFLDLAVVRFASFLDQQLPVDPLTCEFFLPQVVEQLIQSGQADVRVLTSQEQWYGVTYRADLPDVVQALARQHAAGVYPTPLWGPRP